MDENDHRVIGGRLDLWHLQEDAPGMVFWHERGYVIYRVLEDYIRRKMRRLGYKEVKTPQLLPRELWVRSGHWEKFGDAMYRVDAGGREMALKPMSCPCHVQIFNKGLRSWRDLPVRYSEFGICHRDEPSGAMHGLMRTRGFEQDDAHVLCQEQHVYDEVARFIELLREVYADLGFPDQTVILSTRPSKRAGSDAMWDWAEKRLGEAAQAGGASYILQPGEGAFYGPKLEFHLKDRLGRSWQCGTIQLDCALPERLGASYIQADGSRAVPLMIHHAIFGSIGRFIALLLEHYEGRLPFWLSPDQVALLPISKDQAEYIPEVERVFEDAHYRSVCLDGADTLSRRIVMAREFEVPVLAIFGKKEEKERKITIRARDSEQRTVPLEQVRAVLESLQ